MSIATVMVYVGPAQQAEGQVRAARAIVAKFDASVIGVSAFAVEPNFVAEGVIIEETTPEDLKSIKLALAEKERWFRDVVGFSKDTVERRWNPEFPTVFLANEARSADLVVIKSKQDKVDPYHLIDPGERSCAWDGRSSWCRS